MKKNLSLLSLFLFFSGSLFAAELPDFTDLINNTAPAVVKINVSQTSNAALTNMPDIYRDFFGYQNPPAEESAVGSGFIITDNGYILTNNHVIQNASEIVVRLNSRQEYRAEVVGTDPQSDLALLKIPADHLPIVKFADADSLEVGDWVLAIGSPFDLDYSASAGIVSALGRSLPNGSGQNYVPFIQTDVAINPGNSGGPLFNLRGEVVGVNSQIYTRSGGYMGLSFAIPSAVAQDVVKQLMSGGVVERGWLGVYIQDITQDLATSFGLDRPHGALISQVVEGGPAEQAGLMAGDVVIEFNHHAIEYSHDLPSVVGLLAAGSSAPAVIYREGRQKTLSVAIGTLPNQTAAIGKTPRKPPSSSPSSIFGMELSDIGSGAGGINSAPAGVQVDSVLPNSAAAKAGLQAGDIIVQLGFKNVTNLADFRDIAASLPTGKVQPIRFYREGEAIFSTIELN